MAEVLISPGVLARENDQSQITAGPVQAGAAIIGPTVKGQQNIPKLVTSYSEYLANFGSTFLSGSNQYTYFTSISAYNYFQNGGTSLLVTRVTPGAFSPATSTTASNNTGTGALVLANILPQVGTNPTDQDDMAATAVAISSTTGNGTGGQVTLTFAGGAGTATCTVATVSTAGTGYEAGDTITFSAADLNTATGGGGATDLTFLLIASNVVGSGTAFTLETLSHGNIMNSTGSGVSTGTNGTLTSGSSDNFIFFFKQKTAYEITV